MIIWTGWILVYRCFIPTCSVRNVIFEAHRKTNVCYKGSDVITEWTTASHPSVLTLKKLPDLSVRPEGGFPRGVGEQEAMLTSCPRDWLSLGSDVCLRSRPCQQGPQLCGSETHFSCGETRGNSRFGHSQCYGGAGLLECVQRVCFSSRLVFLTFSSPSLLTLLPPLSSSSLYLWMTPFIFLSHSNPQQIF